MDVIFNAAIDLIIFGKRLYLAASFNLKDPVGSLKLGADKATVWYKDMMNRKNPTSTSENYYDNANPNTDFEMSGQCCRNEKGCTFSVKVSVAKETMVLHW